MRPLTVDYVHIGLENFSPAQSAKCRASTTFRHVKGQAHVHPRQLLPCFEVYGLVFVSSNFTKLRLRSEYIFPRGAVAMISAGSCAQESCPVVVTDQLCRFDPSLPIPPTSLRPISTRGLFLRRHLGRLPPVDCLESPSVSIRYSSYDCSIQLTKAADKAGPTSRGIHLTTRLV